MSVFLLAAMEICCSICAVIDEKGPEVGSTVFFWLALREIWCSVCAIVDEEGPEAALAVDKRFVAAHKPSSMRKSQRPA